MEVIISTWRMGASILKLILSSSTWNYTTFHSFFSMLKKKIIPKLTGLWLVGEVVNHVGIMDLRWPRVFRRSKVGLFRQCVQSYSYLFFSRMLRDVLQYSNLNKFMDSRNYVQFQPDDYVRNSCSCVVPNIRWCDKFKIMRSFINITVCSISN